MNDTTGFFLLVTLVTIDCFVEADLVLAWVVVLLFWIGFGGTR